MLEIGIPFPAVSTYVSSPQHPALQPSSPPALQPSSPPALQLGSGARCGSVQRQALALPRQSIGNGAKLTSSISVEVKNGGARPSLPIRLHGEVVNETRDNFCCIRNKNKKSEVVTAATKSVSNHEKACSVI
jgi:hypothetical protein